MEHEIRSAIDRFSTRMRGAVDAELDTLAAELTQAAHEAELQSRADIEATIIAREAEARRDAESQLSQRIEEMRTQAAAAARGNERDARLAAVERLLASVRRIDAAASLRETLDVLVQSASLETPRVALLLIEDASVRPFAHRGFSDIPPAGQIAAGGVVEACVEDGQPAFTGDAARLKAPAFAALADDRAGFAAPLRVGGKTVAVLYADDAGGDEHDAPAAWPEALELLARHTSTHLENLTALRTVTGSHSAAHDIANQEELRAETDLDDDAARRYARLLVLEIKLYNEAAVKLGREHKDLRSRLRDEIDRAHDTYRQRVPETVAARDAYFETELLHTLADGDQSALA